MSSTTSTEGARSHARAQATTAQLRVPATPEGATGVSWAEVVPAGSYATRVLGRGTRLRLTDPDGGACAHVLLFRADASWERLNVADTVKVPWQAYLGAGHPLLSDQGRVLATVVADTSGHHDALCGTSPVARAPPSTCCCTSPSWSWWSMRLIRSTPSPTSPTSTWWRGRQATN